MADSKDIALLLAEGEAAKAKAFKEWLDVEPSVGPLEARVVLWRTYFAHIAAAERYLELANGTDGVAIPAALLKQEPLGAEFERVLVDNLPQLYSRDDAGVNEDGK